MSAGTLYQPKLGGNGRPPIAHDGFGGGDNQGRGRGDEPNDLERLKRYRLGLALALIAITMLFVGLSSTFLLREHFGRWSLQTGTYVRDWKPIPIPFALLFFNTAMLFLSSLCAEMARRASIRDAILEPVLMMPGIAREKPNRFWLLASTVLGITFIVGQVRAWTMMTHRGFVVSTGPSTSFFYFLTGAHAIHLAVGVFVLLYAACAGLFGRRAGSQRILVDVASWYWHVMGLLWVGILALLVFVS